MKYLPLLVNKRGFYDQRRGKQTIEFTKKREEKMEHLNKLRRRV